MLPSSIVEGIRVEQAMNNVLKNGIKKSEKVRN